MAIKRIGILAGGGPAPGTNGVISAIAIEAINHGCTPVGFHDGFEWLYVLNGRLRLILGERDLTLPPGEAAEFDSSVPHWLGSADGGVVELLILFDPQGMRTHVHAGPHRPSRGGSRRT